MPTLIEYIRKLQDAEYERSANAMLSAIGQMTKGQGAEIQALIVALEKQAKEITDAGKLVSSEVYSEMLAQFRGDMNKVERLIRQTAPDIELSGARAANNSVTARLFYGTSQDMIDAGLDPTSAEAMAYFMQLVKDVGIPFEVPKPEDLVIKYSQSQEFIDRMDKWGDGYADYFDDAIRNGVREGWSPAKVARYARDMATNIPVNAAYTWTRTLQLQSYRDASAQMELLNGRFIEKKIRIAALDGRTCPACIALHGIELKKGEPVKDHYNGRCDAIYVPAGGEMPEFMQAMSEPGKRQFTKWQNGTDWFDAQSDAYKQKVLGKGRFDLYQQGKFKLDADFVKWHDDDVFGMMPGVKPLWELEGFDSCKDKIASKQIVDFTDFMRIIKDNNIKSYDELEKYFLELPKRKHNINLSGNPNVDFDYEMKFKNLIIHSTEETMRQASYSFEGLYNLANRLPDRVSDELFKDINNMAFMNYKCKQYPQASATGGWGDIIFYKGHGYSESTFIHEIGHNIAGRNQGLFETAFEEFVKMGEKPPTSYAMTNTGEDIAETFALFFTEPKRLYNTSPKRFKFLADYFKWEPPTW